VKDLQAGTIDGRPVGFDCRGEMLRQNNTVCQLGTYQGGYRCCEGGMVLLDADQAQPEGVDEYYLKVRFWYEPYHEQQQEQQEQQQEEEEKGELGVVRASHAHLFRLYLQTEQQAVRVRVGACVGENGWGAGARAKSGGDLFFCESTHRGRSLLTQHAMTEPQGEYDVPPCNNNTTRPEDCVHVLTRCVCVGVHGFGMYQVVMDASYTNGGGHPSI
jgi:hypothetical protein